jgi:hypothetical protein
MVFDVNGTDVVAYKYSLDNGPYNTTERLVKLPIDLSGLTTGAHTIRVIGRDLVGNWQLDASATVATWVVAIAPPQITVNAFVTPTALATVSLTGTVTADAAATLTGFTIINSTTSIAGTATVTGTNWSAADLPLVSGLNTITISASDSAGNVTTKTIVIEMMGSAPTATILSGAPPVQTNATGLNLTIGGTGVVAYQYRLDGDAYGATLPVGTPLTVGPLTEGQHALRVIGRDEAGNWQADPVNPTISWIIDTTPPTLALTQLATPTSALSQTIRGTVEAGSTVSVAFDTGATGGSAIVIGTNWQFTTPNNPTTGLKSGINTLTITATDPAGNKTTLAATIEYDATAPVATLIGTPPATTRATDATLLVGGDGIVAYRYSLDNGGYSAPLPVSTPITLTGLIDGPHTVAVLGRKLSGLEQTSATTAAWTIDTTPPVAAIVSGRPAAQTSQQDLAITVGGTGVVLYRYSLDGEPYSPEAPIATPISRTGLLVGAHVINIIGRDEAGNWQVVPTQVTWTIDTTPPPGVLISGLPPNPSNSTALNLTISGSDVAFYQYKLDNEDYSAATGIATPLLRTVPEGTHTIAIRGIDLAGNVQVIPTTHTWTIDVTPPITTASPQGGEYDNTLDVTLTSNETTATIYYTIDGTTPTINSSIYTTPLRVGKTTTIRFFARDLAGNLEAVHDETYTFIANGDIDGDGRITVLDALRVIRHIVKVQLLSTDEFKRADVATNSPGQSPLNNNRPKPDNKVDIVDLQILLQLIVRILSW